LPGQIRKGKAKAAEAAVLSERVALLEAQLAAASQAPPPQTLGDTAVSAAADEPSETLQRELMELRDAVSAHEREKVRAEQGRVATEAQSEREMEALRGQMANAEVAFQRQLETLIGQLEEVTGALGVANARASEAEQLEKALAAARAEEETLRSALAGAGEGGNGSAEEQLLKVRGSSCEGCEEWEVERGGEGERGRREGE
jgi:hypothetical protein